MVADRIVAIREGRVVFDGSPERLDPIGLNEIYRDEPVELAPEHVP
jgi:ABC-type phosphate/phosphonate transport system ATPase subunit